MPELKYQAGRLSCRTKSTGAERGREDWWLTRNRDGTVTMRCLAMTDEAQIVRDVSYTRTKDGRPTDLFLRLQVADRLIGTGYLHVHGDSLNVITDGPETGHLVQSLRAPVGAFSVVTHAAMSDGWLYFAYDRTQGGEQLRPVYHTATRSDAADGPLGRLETWRLSLIGEEEVAVPAGKFKATHLQVGSADSNVPASELWVAGEDRILLRCVCAERDLEYLLTSWKVEQPPPLRK